MALSVLISAELIGIVYYRALSEATQSSWLKAICARLLADEAAHVGYEAQMLGLLRADRSAVARWFSETTHEILFAGATFVVLFGHLSVLRAGGFTPASYLAACRREFERYLGGSRQRQRQRAPVAA